MNLKRKLLLVASILLYVATFGWFVFTACLFSVNENFYRLTLVLGLLSLYIGLHLSVIREKMINGELSSRDNLIYFVLSIASIVGAILPLPFALASVFMKDEIVEEKKIEKPTKEKKERKFFLKPNLILTVVGLVGIILGSVSAMSFESSGYLVYVNDFRLTKEMTEEFNGGEDNKLNGRNDVIENEDCSFSVTQYTPKSASPEHPAPVIFVMPGFTRTKATMSQYAIEYSRRGAVVFTIDPGSQGGTTYAGFDEKGDSISSTVGANGMNYLVQYVYNNVDQYTYIDRERFGAIGHSAGGNNVCETAARFAGSTYQTSIIKSLYISGYIKLTAANRFINLRCNTAMSYGYYDEGVFRYQTKLDSLEVVSLRFINEVNGAHLDNKSYEIDKEYGDMSDGSYRIIRREDINHCFQMYHPESIENTISFFHKTLNMETDVADDSQIWMGKEISNGAMLVFAFIFIFALAGALIDLIPFMKNLRANGKERVAYEMARNYISSSQEAPVLQESELSGNADILVKKPAKPQRKQKSVYDKFAFWALMILTAIIACLDFIPLARLSIALFPEAHATDFTWYFPARMMNAVFLWAIVNGTIGLVLWAGIYAIENGVIILRNKLTGSNIPVSWDKFKGLKVKPLDLVKSLVYAVVLFFIFYGVLQVVYNVTHQDYRFMLISASPLQPRMVVTWLMYLAGFYIFYVSNSIRVNLSIAYEGWSEWKVMLVGALANSLGLVFILIINYWCYFTTGTVYYGFYSSTDTTEMWLFVNMVFGLIPMMALLPIVNRITYKMSGNVYFGALLNCMIFIMMSIGASVSYIPM
ncbi:MAG: hypothetical protein IJ186_03630 [Bacilli bacterium]|nr:hypothetical protein [Bacilli bacterium]